MDKKDLLKVAANIVGIAVVSVAMGEASLTHVGIHFFPSIGYYDHNKLITAVELALMCYGTVYLSILVFEQFIRVCRQTILK